MALAPGPILLSLWSLRAESPGLQVSHSRRVPAPFPGAPRTIFIACAPGGPPPRAQARLGWNVVSLAPFSFVYFLPCTQALPEPLPFSIVYPNSNKAVTKDPGPTALFQPAQGPGKATPGWVEGLNTALSHRCRRRGLGLLLSPVPETEEQEIMYVS